MLQREIWKRQNANSKTSLYVLNQLKGILIVLQLLYNEPHTTYMLVRVLYPFIRRKYLLYFKQLEKLKLEELSIGVKTKNLYKQ